MSFTDVVAFGTLLVSVWAFATTFLPSKRFEVHDGRLALVGNGLKLRYLCELHNMLRCVYGFLYRLLLSRFSRDLSINDDRRRVVDCR